MVQAIPEGLRSVTPQLSMDGCAEAIEFYKKAFGAVEVHRAADPSGKKIGTRRSASETRRSS